MENSMKKVEKGKKNQIHKLRTFIPQFNCEIREKEGSLSVNTAIF